MRIIRDTEGQYVAYINGERERTPAFDNIEDCAAYAEEHDEEMRIIEHMDVKGKRMFRCRCIYCRKAGEWVADKRLATLSWNKINTVPEI